MKKTWVYPAGQLQKLLPSWRRHHCGVALEQNNVEVSLRKMGWGLQPRHPVSECMPADEIRSNEPAFDRAIFNFLLRQDARRGLLL